MMNEKRLKDECNSGYLELLSMLQDKANIKAVHSKIVEIVENLSRLGRVASDDREEINRKALALLEVAKNITANSSNGEIYSRITGRNLEDDLRERDRARGQNLPAREQPRAPREQPLSPREQPRPSREQSLPPREQPLSPREQPLPPSVQPLPPIEQPRPPREQSLPPREQPLSPREQPLPPSVQPLPPIEQPRPSREQPLPPIELPRPPRVQPLPPRGQPLPPRVQPLPPMFSPIGGGENLAPIMLDDYIGQAQTKESLREAIEAAISRRRPLRHILFFGSSGLGKTSLARVVANEMGSNLIVMSGPTIKDVLSMVHIIKNVRRGDIVFIDEIHRMPIQVAEAIYTAMEDFRLTYIDGKGEDARNVNITLPPFTVIGATTHSGLLEKPMRDRFDLQFRLEAYKEEEIADLASITLENLGNTITMEGAVEIAKRSRGTPRICISFVKRIYDRALNRRVSEIDADFVNEFFKDNGIDSKGLEENMDIAYMKRLYEKFLNRPIGINNLAAALGEGRNIIENQIEPYLIYLGFLKITTKGRKLTASGAKYLIENYGVTPLDNEEVEDTNEGEIEEEISREDSSFRGNEPNEAYDSLDREMFDKQDRGKQADKEGAKQEYEKTEEVVVREVDEGTSVATDEIREDKEGGQVSEKVDKTDEAGGEQLSKEDKETDETGGDKVGENTGEQVGEADENIESEGEEADEETAGEGEETNEEVDEEVTYESLQQIASLIYSQIDESFLDKFNLEVLKQKYVIKHAEFLELVEQVIVDDEYLLKEFDEESQSYIPIEVDVIESSEDGNPIYVEMPPILQFVKVGLSYENAKIASEYWDILGRVRDITPENDEFLEKFLIDKGTDLRNYLNSAENFFQEVQLFVAG